jgi:hypothetical protein
MLTMMVILKKQRKASGEKVIICTNKLLKIISLIIFKSYAGIAIVERT